MNVVTQTGLWSSCLEAHHPSFAILCQTVEVRRSRVVLNEVADPVFLVAGLRDLLHFVVEDNGMLISEDQQASAVFLVGNEECITEHLRTVFSGVKWIKLWFAPRRLLISSSEDRSHRWSLMASISEEDGKQLVRDWLSSVVLRDKLEAEVLTIDADSLELVKFAVAADIIGLMEDEVDR